MADGRGALIVGATTEGLQAALTLARLNRPVRLIDPDREVLDDEPVRRRLYIEATAHHLIDIAFNTDLLNLADRAEGVSAHLVQRNWVAPDRCLACGKCLDVCPVDLGDGVKPISLLTGPHLAAIAKIAPAPCRTACPLGMTAQGYVALIGQGRISEAYDLIQRTNPLPGVCGRVCHHPCEEACRRGEVDAAVAICDLKRFASDQAGDGFRRIRPTGDGPTIAVIGSGPAGLTAAHDLALAGFQVRLIEADDRPGGLLWKGIAPYRLPTEVLNKDIDRILDLGVELELNRPIHNYAAVEALKEEGCQAIVLAIGASADRSMGLPGEDLPGVRGCVGFLNGLWRGEKPGRLGKAVVIGGGNAAIEAARTSLRHGAESVTIVYRRTRDEMPADSHEIDQALEEGAELLPLTLPLEFKEGNGRVGAMVCQAMKLTGVDASGRARPEPVAGSEFELAVDTVIVSIGQQADLACVMTDDSPLSERGLIDASAGACLPGVYAAGDVTTGPSTVSQAMASGRAAARRLVADLRPDRLADLPPTPPEPPPTPPDYRPIPETISKIDRVACHHRQPADRVTDCLEVIDSLNVDQAMAEAKRCLQCGGCSECLQCQIACDLEVIDHFQPIQPVDRLFSQVILTGDQANDGNFKSDRLTVIPPPADRTSPDRALIAGRAAAMAVVDSIPAARLAPKPTPPVGRGDRWGLFLCSCNNTLNQDGRLDELLASMTQSLGADYGQVLTSACHPVHGLEIEQTLNENNLTGLILASCTCCHLDFACDSCDDQRIRLKRRLFQTSGLNPLRTVLVNYKEGALLPFKGARSIALEAAGRIIRAGASRLAVEPDLTLAGPGASDRAVVLGLTQAGLAAALGLVKTMNQVTVVDPRPDQTLAVQLAVSGVDLVSGCTPRKLTGRRGDFTILTDGESIPAGLIILADESTIPLYRAEPWSEPAPLSAGPGGLATNIPGIYLAAWGQSDNLPPEIMGRAAAGLAAENRLRRAEGLLASRIDRTMCRGCGRCAEVCPVGAARLTEPEPGLHCAVIDPDACLGCGNCLAVCPTGAAQGPDQNRIDDKQVLYAVLG